VCCLQGNALREAGRAEEAINCYTACIQLQYSKSQQQGLATLLPGRTGPASAALPAAASSALIAAASPAAILQRQRLSVAYNNLGGILKMQGQALAAIACYEQVAVLQQDSPEAQANLASAYKDAARHDMAIVAYKRALVLRSDFPEAFANLVHRWVPACLPATAAGITCTLHWDIGTLGHWDICITYTLHWDIGTLGHLHHLHAPWVHEWISEVRSASLQIAEPCTKVISGPGAVAEHTAPGPAAEHTTALACPRSLQCVCDWTDRPALFKRLEVEIQRDLAAGKLPPVQPFHAMAYPVSAELALAISRKYAEHCLQAAQRWVWLGAWLWLLLWADRSSVCSIAGDATVWVHTQGCISCCCKWLLLVPRMVHASCVLSADSCAFSVQAWRAEAGAPACGSTAARRAAARGLRQQRLWQPPSVPPNGLRVRHARPQQGEALRRHLGPLPASRKFVRPAACKLPLAAWLRSTHPAPWRMACAMMHSWLATQLQSAAHLAALAEAQHVCEHPLPCLPSLQVEVFCYALSPNDQSEWRQRIEREAEHFVDCSAWGVPEIAARWGSRLHGYMAA
jgi:tetratricopeptide (TPR) repeat protein